MKFVTADKTSPQEKSPLGEVEDLLALAEQADDRRKNIERQRGTSLRRIGLLLLGGYAAIVLLFLLATQVEPGAQWPKSLHVAAQLGLAALLGLVVNSILSRWRDLRSLRTEIIVEDRIRAELVSLISGLLKTLPDDADVSVVQHALLEMRLRRIPFAPKLPTEEKVSADKVRAAGDLLTETRRRLTSRATAKTDRDDDKQGVMLTAHLAASLPETGNTFQKMLYYALDHAAENQIPIRDMATRFIIPAARSRGASAQLGHWADGFFVGTAVLLRDLGIIDYDKKELIRDFNPEFRKAVRKEIDDLPEKSTNEHDILDRYSLTELWNAPPDAKQLPKGGASKRS